MIIMAVYYWALIMCQTQLLFQLLLIGTVSLPTLQMKNWRLSEV